MSKKGFILPDALSLSASEIDDIISYLRIFSHIKTLDTSYPSYRTGTVFVCECYNFILLCVL